jgi:hypothetical protein
LLSLVCVFRDASSHNGQLNAFLNYVRQPLGAKALGGGDQIEPFQETRFAVAVVPGHHVHTWAWFEVQRPDIAETVERNLPKKYGAGQIRIGMMTAR